MNTISGENWRVLHGDCREAFLSLPAKSVHCIVTSPPYWGGIRDYGIGGSKWADGWEGCYGNEPTVEQYVAHTLEVFEAISHALRDDGVIWWNVGDCYCTGKGSMHNPGGGAVSLHGRIKDAGALVTGAAPNRMPQSIRAGNKALVPYRVALGLQDAGWIVRQDVIWRKPSPMPESIDGWRWERCRVKVEAAARPRQCGHHSDGREVSVPIDRMPQSVWAACEGCDKCRNSDGYVLRRGSWRPTTAHEFVFQIVKGPEYFSDAAAAQETAIGGAPGNKEHKSRIAYQNGAGDRTQRRQSGVGFIDAQESRNPRSVWAISSEAYKGKHFAAFPTMLAWKCIQASTSAGGCCAACGSQYAPVVEKVFVPQGDVCEEKRHKGSNKGTDEANGWSGTPRGTVSKKTTGYRPTCDCNVGSVPCVVADPFTGSGTTMQVAINTGRQFVGSEIAAHYLPLIEQRAATPWAPKTEKRPSRKRKRHRREQVLFT